MATSPTASSSFVLSDERLDRWLAALLATPGLTAIRDDAEARATLLDGALAAAELLGDGPVVDVGSGGGSPGSRSRRFARTSSSLCSSRTDASATSSGRLRPGSRTSPWSVSAPRSTVPAQGRDAYGTAVARALAAPPVAAEWCLPLVRPGGRAVLFVGPSADLEAVAKAAGELAAEVEESPSGFVLLRKTGPTPERFPRRPGVAKKRPLA